MKGKKLWGFGMAAVMLASMFTGKISAEASGDKDVVTALLPPVSATYQDKIRHHFFISIFRYIYCHAGIHIFRKTVRTYKCNVRRRSCVYLHI